MQVWFLNSRIAVARVENSLPKPARRLQLSVSFKIRGPFDVPTVRGKGGRGIELYCPDFWSKNQKATKYKEKATKYKDSCGCYVFALGAGRGTTPIYVGKTAKSFEKECFTLHKIYHYNRALSQVARGKPVMFLVVLERAKGKVNQQAIAEAELFLIQSALERNPNLSNSRNTKKVERWGIEGVIRSSGKGRIAGAAREFRNALGL